MDSLIELLQTKFITEIIETFPLAMLALSLVSVGLVLYLSRSWATFRFADILTGISLILIAMLYAGLIGDLSAKVPAENKSNYDLVYWVIPFYSAAIGSNFISNAFLGKREYIKWEKSHTNRLWDGLWLILIVMSVVFPPLLLVVFVVVTRRFFKNKRALAA